MSRRDRGFLVRLITLALLSVVLSAGAWAQDNGTVTGTVTDAKTSEPVAGATILIIGTQRTGVAGSDGSYSVSVPAGDYIVLAAASGYESAEEPVTVAAGETATVDFSVRETLSQFGDTLVVVGSRTARTAIETPVPVDVLPFEELVQTGMSETSRMIQFLAPSFNFSTSTISDGTDILRPSTLRGLSPDQTLVLVNGKRRHNTALVHVNGSIGRGTAGIDLNAIPASAIERIEVLRDGAAAQYGSDAIAGVINVVLKSSVDKTRIDIGAGEHFEGDGEVFQASANHGWALGDGGFFNVTAEYRDRGFTNRSGLDTRQIYATLPDGSPDSREATYNRRNHRYGDAESENVYLFFNGEIPAGDGDFYFFGGFSERDGESAGFNRLPGQTRTNTLLHPDGHLPLINTGVDDLSLSAGYRGSIGDRWSYDAGVVTGENEFNFLISNSANTSLWDASPTAADAGTLSFDQTTFTLDFYGSLDWGMENPVAAAFGVEYREDGYEIEAGEIASWVDGGEPNQFCRPPWPQPDSRCGGAPAGIQVFPGFQPVNEVDASRDNIAVYGDLEFQLSDDFLLGLAARFEDYSDFGSTVDGKITARYEVNDQVAIRGSASTGFRAPSLHQANLANISTQFVQDPVTLETVPVEVGTFRNPSPITQVFGVPELEEETSTSFSVGFTARPQDNLSITADAYTIDIDDRIVLSGRFSTSIPQIAPLLDSIGVGAGQFFTNALDTETEGLDLVVAYVTPAGPGQFDLTAAASWSGTDIAGPIKTPPILEGLGETLFNDQERVYLQESQPHQAYNIGGRYSQGPFAVMTRVNYFGKVASTESTTGNPDSKQVFRAKWLTDIDFSWEFGNGITWHVGGNNVFDEFPDESFPQTRSNVTFIYPRRTAPFGFNGGYYYSRFSFEF
jgi:iron complex outermembrane receptor protein